MVEDITDREKRFKKIWSDSKYDIIGKIRNATPKNEADKAKKGLSVLELSDLVDLPPRETQKFLEQMIDWGANIWVKKNQVLAYKELAITSNTYSASDLDIGFEKIDVFGEEKEGVRFGVICDTHFGSHRSAIAMLRAAYRFYESEGIKNVIVAGNILAGKPHSKYGFDLMDKTLEGQLKRFKK